MKIKPNQFTSYELSPEEELAGSAYTETQRAVLQNKLSVTMTELALMQINLNDPSTLQHEAELQGRARCLTELLEQHATLVSLAEVN